MKIMGEHHTLEHVLVKADARTPSRTAPNMCSSPCAASYDDAEVLGSDVVATACRHAVSVMLQLLEVIVL